MARGEITLPVLNDTGSPPVNESLAVEQTGPKRFRLIHSPGLVEGLASGDEIELDNEAPSRYKIVRRSGNVCVWVFLPDSVPEDELKNLRREVEQLGGHIDGGTHRSLIFTIPVATGFKSIEQLFNAFERRVSKASWMFANVYDPSDGRTPLNWWQEGT